MRPGSNADKRARVTELLTRADATTRSDRDIAREVGASQPFVSKMRRQFSAQVGAVPVAAAEPVSVDGEPAQTVVAAEPAPTGAVEPGAAEPAPTPATTGTTPRRTARTFPEQLHHDRYGYWPGEVVVLKREPNAAAAIWSPDDTK